MKSIVSFDLDMTLLDHNNWGIPDSALRAVEKLREHFFVVIASGRDMDHEYSSGYRDMIRPDAVIHMNGTRVTVGDKQIFEHFFDKKLLRQVLEFADNRGYSVGVSLSGKDYYTNPNRVKAHDQTRWDMSQRHFDDAWKLMDMDVRTLAFIGNEAEAKLMEQQFPQLKLPMFAGKQGADVVERGISKGDGLVALCSYLGVDLRNTYAFGDSMNDLEIVTMAGTGIAMGNAIEELKTAADYITDPIDKDGVWNACVHFGLISEYDK